MSQQSAGIRAPYMEQKRYFLGLSCTVWQKAQQRQKKYISNNVRGVQTLWIVRRDTFVPDYANITAVGNDCTVGCVEINT